jgi:flagellar biosynthetic protein FliO
VKKQTKKIIFLLIIILSGGVLVALSGRSAEPAPVPSVEDRNEDGFANDSNFLTNADKNAPNPIGDNRELFFKMMLSVLLVIALGAAVFYFSKKLLPKIANQPGKQIHILETTYLGPKKALHLIKAGNQRLLISSTNENISMLADVTFALSEYSLQKEENNTGSCKTRPVEV